MATRCFRPLFGRRIRLTALDECGNVPEAGSPCTTVVSEGFTTVSLTSEIEDGVEITPRLANGGICFSEMGDPSFKRFTTDIEFCDVDPDIFAIAANAEGYEDYNDDTSGFTISEGTISKRFALELWLGVQGAECEEGGSSAGAYLLLPFVSAGILGDLSVTGDSEITFSISGAFTKSGNNWGVGPYDVMLDSGTPEPLPTALDPLDHLLLTRADVAPPPAACGCAAMPGSS